MLPIQFIILHESIMRKHKYNCNYFSQDNFNLVFLPFW